MYWLFLAKINFINSLNLNRYVDFNDDFCNLYQTGFNVKHVYANTSCNILSKIT